MVAIAVRLLCALETQRPAEAEHVDVKRNRRFVGEEYRLAVARHVPWDNFAELLNAAQFAPWFKRASKAVLAGFVLLEHAVGIAATGHDCPCHLSSSATA